MLLPTEKGWDIENAAERMSKRKRNNWTQPPERRRERRKGHSNNIFSLFWSQLLLWSWLGAILLHVLLWGPWLLVTPLGIWLLLALLTLHIRLQNHVILRYTEKNHQLWPYIHVITCLPLPIISMLCLSTRRKTNPAYHANLPLRYKRVKEKLLLDSKWNEIYCRIRCRNQRAPSPLPRQQLLSVIDTFFELTFVKISKTRTLIFCCVAKYKHFLDNIQV